MFFIMRKRVSFLIFMILVCVMSVGIISTTGQTIDEQKEELQEG